MSFPWQVFSSIVPFQSNDFVAMAVVKALELSPVNLSSKPSGRIELS